MTDTDKIFHSYLLRMFLAEYCKSLKCDTLRVNHDTIFFNIIKDYVL